MTQHLSFSVVKCVITYLLIQFWSGTKNSWLQLLDDLNVSIVRSRWWWGRLQLCEIRLMQAKLLPHFPFMTLLINFPFLVLKFVMWAVDLAAAEWPWSAVIWVEELLICPFSMISFSRGMSCLSHHASYHMRVVDHSVVSTLACASHMLNFTFSTLI